MLARALGHEVSGSDANVYPPMSTLLRELDISLHETYDANNLIPQPDQSIIGNVLSRGNVEVEAALDSGIPYISGAQWLSENVLQDRWVLAVAGTHGKTTTGSMLAWILEAAGMNPGFLVGGVPINFGVSARLGDKPFFVIEADEYDTAFFDKRSKFIHYRPRTAVLNNLEFDHADIFPDLDAIKTQFHYFIRTIPASGRLIVNSEEHALKDVLARGCWSEVETFGDKGDWSVQAVSADGTHFRVLHQGKVQGEVEWELMGEHNMKNALAAIAAAHHVGIETSSALEALGSFKNVKRRMEICYQGRGGVTVYDDFAHHPTEIAATLSALRERVGSARIIAVIELRSNTMRMGIHRDTLPASLETANEVVMLRPHNLDWNLNPVVDALPGKARVFDNVDEIVKYLDVSVGSNAHIVIMSNGGFDGLHSRLTCKFSGKKETE